MAPRRLSFHLLPLLCVLAVACAPAPGTVMAPSASPPSIPTDAPTVSAEPAAAFPLTLTDDAGREVTIGARPERVVSLAPSNTEIVCAIGGCDTLAGVPEFLDGYPDDVLATVADLPKVVSFGPIDLEAVVAAEPDLVRAAGNELTSSADIARLEELGLSVLTLYPETLDGVYADIELVGVAMDRSDEAAELVAGMRDRVAAVSEAVAGLERPRTFYEVSVFEGIIYTAGEDSFLASLLDLAGAEAITGDALSTSIPIEALVAADPELILLGDASYDATITAESVAARPGWAEMTAVVEGSVLPIEEDVLITRPGPRIVDGLEVLARVIHPEAFE